MRPLPHRRTGCILPDDFLDIIVAGFLASTIGISMRMALLLTYTVIAWTIFIIGASIYPYNTMRLMSGFYHKLTGTLWRIVTNPMYLALSVIMMIVIYYMAMWYSEWLMVSLI